MMAQLQGILGELGAREPIMGRLFAPVVEAARQGPVVEVTPFGRYALARVPRGHGLDVPTVGHLADVAADDLLLALGGHASEDAIEEVRRWLDARGERWREALGDVVRSASGTGDEGPARRSVLPVVVGVAAAAAAAMLDEWQRDPWLAAPVVIGRYTAGQGPEPSLAHMLWMAVDALSLGLDDEDGFAELMDSTPVAEMLAAPGGTATAVAREHPPMRARCCAGLLRSWTILAWPASCARPWASGRGLLGRSGADSAGRAAACRGDDVQDAGGC